MTFGQFILHDGPVVTKAFGREAYVEGYRNQLTFVTARQQSVIEETLSQSPTPPVVIVQSDHGPGSLLDWQDAQGMTLSERLSILNAYYFPDQRYDALYPEITPVNTFRV